MRVALCLGTMLAFAALPSHLSAQHAVASVEQPLIHRPVTGAAGGFARATVILHRTSAAPDAGFGGVLVASGRRMPLAGPDEPADFFLFDVTAVLFTPLERGGRNGVVVLYNSSQIGPGHGTERRALVYRVTAHAARRVPAVERQLQGAASAAEVRRRLFGRAR